MINDATTSPADPPPELQQTAAVYFGGPDQPPRALRDLLKARIEASGPGSEITWAVYYFRDPELAHALIAAKRRGVRVRVVVEASPRRRQANDEVIEQLRRGLGDDLRVHRSWLPGAHLHAKIYTFGGTQPEAYIGSFNPATTDADDPNLIRRIGDQDRGENLLVQFRETAVVRALRAETVRLWNGKGMTRFAFGQNRVRRSAETRLYYYPRLRPDVVDRALKRLGPGDSVEAAVSHMDGGPFARRLADASRRGAKVAVVVHAKRSRVTPAAESALRAAGVEVIRYCNADRLPMHGKFVVVTKGERRTAWFGSLNYNSSSRYLNQEVLARSTNPKLVQDLQARFRMIADRAESAAGSCRREVGAKAVAVQTMVKPPAL